MSGDGEKTATGRPSDPMPLLPRVLLFLVLLVVTLEMSLRFLAAPGSLEGPVAVPFRIIVAPLLKRYLPMREWVMAHPILATVLALVLAVVSIIVIRWWLIFWNNQIKARLSGTFLTFDTTKFPVKQFDLFHYIKSRKPGTTFVGLRAIGRAGGWKWEPVSISLKQRSMHTHILGKTGSGKTASVIWPTVLQDALDGKGILVMDAKGSDENIRTMKAIAALAGRQNELKVFALPAWNQPHVFSHTYNMVYVRPRTATDIGGDPVAVAERVFAILPLGDNEYYNTQAQVMFVNINKALHGLVDDLGTGYIYTLRDVACCLKGWGDTGAYSQALNFVLANTKDTEAAREAQNQVARLGKDTQKALSGVIGAVDKFMSPLVNAYAPDIVFEDLMQTNGMVYIQLPGNLFKLQAPAMGKVMLMDVQQEGSLRQVFRATKNQTPYSVIVDEFYNFADPSIIDSLNKLRDAHVHYTLAHQSISDLETVSPEFATGTWDNTRTKFILNQDNPELCEKVSKSIGTKQIIEKTVRQQQGALFTSLSTGDAGTKLVETFKLHPNAIKSLASCGQGYCYFGDDIMPLAFSMLPELQADFELPKKSQANARGLKLEAKYFATLNEAAASVDNGSSEDT